MGPESVKLSFSKRFPELYKDIQKTISDWHRNFLQISRPNVYLGGEKLMALTTFGHKIILETTDLQSLKPLLRQSPTDLVLSALLVALHTVHSNYLYVQPSHSFHPINIASLVKKSETTIHVVADTASKLFEIATNLHLNDLEDSAHFVQGSHWKPKADFFQKKPLSSLEPTNTIDKTNSSKFDTKQADYDAFVKTIAEHHSPLLENLMGDDFINLRAIIFEKSSLHQLEESDLDNMLLFNPSCYWLVFLSPESEAVDALALSRLTHAKNLGYEIWQLPNFAVFEPTHIPAFGKWLLLTNPSFV